MFYDNDPHKKREQLRKKREFDQHRMSIEQGSNNVPTPSQICEMPINK